MSKAKTDKCKDCAHRGRASQHRAYCAVRGKYTRKKEIACAEFKGRDE